MTAQIERGQKLYIADEPNCIFEGSLLDLDIDQGRVRLDPVARLTLDAQSKTWTRAPLPKGPARVASLGVVHDEENEARHYAIHHYASPLGRKGTWEHPSKRVWVLTVGEAPATAVAPRGEAARASAMPEPAHA